MTMAGEHHPLAVAAVEALEAYRPAPGPSPDAPWPPRVACLGWNGRPQPNAIHYSRINTLSLMTRMIEGGFCSGELFISRTMTGLPNLLWAPLFDRVTSIRPDLGPGPGSGPPVRDGKHTIHAGRIEDERFIHPVAASVTDLRAVILDDRRYAELCCGYFHFKRVLKRPGIIAIMHATRGNPESSGVEPFLADLSRGHLDNRRHEIITIDEDPEGRGMVYEIIL